MAKRSKKARRSAGGTDVRNLSRAARSHESTVDAQGNEQPRASGADADVARWRSVAVAIVAAVIVLNWNTLGNNLLSYDDRRYIHANPLVTGDGGLGAIWKNEWPDGKPRVQYQPLVLTTFWLEYKRVGLPERTAEDIGQPAHPFFHVNQMLLHALNACLLLWLLRALGVMFWPAAAAVAIFAVHPINVASVAWVTERKNTLSTVFMLSSLLLYVGFRRPARSPQWWRYGLAVGAFALAMFAKTASVVVVPLVVVTDRVLDRRWSWASVLRALPLAGLSAVMVRGTLAAEGVLAKDFTLVDLPFRPLVAGSAIVHYLATMLLPVYQPIVYPRWTTTPGVEGFSEFLLRSALSLVVLSAGAFAAWKFRSKLGPLFLWSMALFLVPLVPYLGVVHFNYMTLSLVADHFMYLGSAGVALAAVLLLQRWYGARPGRPRLVILRALAVVSLGFFSVRTFQQNRVWANDETLWTQTVALNPDCIPAHINLWNHYVRHGQSEKAAMHHSDAVRLYTAAADATRKVGRNEEALAYYESAADLSELKLADAYSARIKYAEVLRALGRSQDAKKQYGLLLQRDLPPDVRDRVDRSIREIALTP